MSETLAQVQSDLLAAHQQIRAIDERYDNGLISDAQDAAEMQRLEKAVVELAEKANALQVADARRARTDSALALLQQPAVAHTHPDYDREGDDEYARKSLGQIFVDADPYQRHLKAGVFDSPNAVVELQVSAGPHTSVYQRLMATRRGQKALMYSNSGVAGAFVTPDYRPGVVDILQRPLTLLDLIATTPTTSETISYVQEDSRTNNAAMVAEATATTGTSGTKPESGMAFSRQTSPVRTAATWIPVTNRMLADAPAIRGLIDQRLLVMLEQTLETEILSGDGTGEHFTGLLHSGIQARAKGSDYPQDAIYKAAVQVAVTGEIQPDTVVLSPLDWQTMRLARESASTATPGSYLLGPPAMGGDDTLWGYRVVLSQALTAGTALVGSFRLGGMYFEREGAVIRTGLINDQFTRNMQTILVEARGSWITFRPTAFCQVTGL